MNILILCEGNPETWASWSGITTSLLNHLRSAGHTVHIGDVDLYGLHRLVAAGGVFAPRRRRWAVKYHLGRWPFWCRSRRAQRSISQHRGRLDVILQIGATFEPVGHGGVPYVLYCDSNIRMAQHGISSGYSDAVSLRPLEIEEVAKREMSVYQDASVIFTISERLRRSFIEDFRIPAERVRTIYAGPNFDVRRISGAARDESGEHPPTILFVGRQFGRKGGDLLVRAFQRVRECIADAQLILVGPPALDIREASVRHLGDLDKNHPGGWAALVDAYASADVFCLPTRFEPFGVAFLEAMYFGLPCIGTQAWAVPEMVLDGVTGFTIPVDDLDALTDRLLRLLRDRTLARRMGEAGRARAETVFTWDAVVDRMMQGIVPLLGRDGNRG